MMVLLKALVLGLGSCSFLIEAVSIDDYNGKIYYGADNNDHCYEVAFDRPIIQNTGVSSFREDASYDEGPDDIYSTGTYVNTKDKVQIFANGGFCSAHSRFETGFRFWRFLEKRPKRP
ncbi:hypothetical protein M885DRAFT_580368 [Pelagophyceae sp. CCMP2097]|nr:hypothetical protein M885DRAFT_580368 [Pelagophyceae sp. CCMP2097]